MNARCQPGDLAIIIREIPGCEDNVGRIVVIRGPLDTNRRNQLTWLISPVTLEPWLYRCLDGVVKFMGYLQDDIEHPDEWMVPLTSADDNETIRTGCDLALENSP